MFKTGWTRIEHLTEGSGNKQPDVRCQVPIVLTLSIKAMPNMRCVGEDAPDGSIVVQMIYEAVTVASKKLRLGEMRFEVNRILFDFRRQNGFEFPF